MNNKYDSDYEIRLATLEAMGGDVSKRYDSVYEIDLEILRLTEEGGGGGAKIDDDTTSTQTVWSSQKTKEEIDNAGGIKLPDNVSITEEAISIFSDLGVTTSLYPDHLAIMGGEGMQLRSDGDVWYFIGDDVVKGRTLKDYLFSSPGKIIKLTQEEYDALEEKEETTLYIIK